MSTLYYESSISHHGIKGQKWGVRRFQNPDGSLTEAGQRRANRYVKPKTAKNYKQKLRDSSMTEARTIPKGTKMFRVTVDKSESVDGIRYVTYLKNDRDFYRGGYANGIREQYGKDSNSALYEKQMHAKEDIKIPSRQEVKDVYTKILSDKKVLNQSLNGFYHKMLTQQDKAEYIRSKGVYWDSSDADKAKAEKEWSKELEKRGKQATKDYIKQYGDKTVDRAFIEASAALGVLPDLKKKVVNELKNRGYNAMVDEAGVGGKGGWVRDGVDPIIVFDGNKTLKEDSTERVNKSTEQSAAKRSTAWQNYANSYEKRNNPW